jgi:hypothetical protein
MTDLFGGTLPITLEAQLREVEREITLRRRVYPRWVADGRLTQAAADRQIAVMEAVAGTLQAVVEKRSVPA